jgi:hypothetical protein
LIYKPSRVKVGVSPPAAASPPRRAFTAASRQQKKTPPLPERFFLYTEGYSHHPSTCQVIFYDTYAIIAVEHQTDWIQDLSGW